MKEVQKLLERQGRWQKTRQALSWPEKIRMAEQIRESARQLRSSGKSDRSTDDDSQPSLPCGGS